MKKAPSTLTMKEYEVQHHYYRNISKEVKKDYKRLGIEKQREILNEYNGAPIEHFADILELIAENEYLETLDRAGKKDYKKKTNFEQHDIIQKFREDKLKKSNAPKVSTIPEPEVYDIEDIVRRGNSVSYEKRPTVLSPGELKINNAKWSMGSSQAEINEALEELQRKHPTKKITYDYKEVEVNYHNQQFFDKIEELYKGVDYDSLALPEQMELDAKKGRLVEEILVNQPTKATPKKATPTKAKKDTKLVEYVKSVEESLNKGVIDKDYAKQAITKYLEENL